MIQRPHRVDRLMAELARTMPGVEFASNVEEAHVLDVLPAITWDPWAAEPVWSYQANFATDHTLTVHIHARSAQEAEDLADDFWVALQSAAETIPPLADGTRFLHVRADIPTEHRTAGQQLRYFNYKFTATVTVGR